jgi:hypothetical protein
VLTYVDANVARFGGTRLVLYAACGRPGCKRDLGVPEEAESILDGFPPIRQFRRTRR